MSDENPNIAKMLEKLPDVLTQLAGEMQSIRQQYGEAAYLQAIADAVELLRGAGPRGESMARSIFKDVDFDKLPPPMGQAVENSSPLPEGNLNPEQTAPSMPALYQIPGCRTQAQLTCVMMAYDALRLLLGVIFTGDKDGQANAREALEGAIKAAEQATQISNSLRDVPEAVPGSTGDEFRKPPTEFGEYDLAKALRLELEAIVTKDALNAWYSTNRTRLDRVTSSSLRAPLFDAIREKKGALNDASS